MSSNPSSGNSKSTREIFTAALAVDDLGKRRELLDHACGGDDALRAEVEARGPIDWTVSDGIREIPIEQRGDDEVTRVSGCLAEGSVETVRIAPADSAAANYAFDVTPARLVSGLITERGVIGASESALRAAYPG